MHHIYLQACQFLNSESKMELLENEQQMSFKEGLYMTAVKLDMWIYSS